MELCSRRISNSVVAGKNDGVAVLEIPSGQELKTFGPLSSYPVAVAVSARRTLDRRGPVR